MAIHVRRASRCAVIMSSALGLATCLAVSADSPPRPAPDKAPAGPAVIDGDALRRTEKRLLAELVREGYLLTEGQEIKRMPRPFVELRTTYYREAHPVQSANIPTSPASMNFHWKNGELSLAMMKWDERGTTLQGVLYECLGIPVQQLNGPESLLQLHLDGDWVVGADVRHWPERAIGQLEQIVRKDFQVDAKLEFREVLKPVYVVRGDYVYKPATKKGQPLPPIDPERLRHADLLEMYAEADELGTGFTETGRGEFGQFLEYIGLWSGAMVVDESTSQASGQIEWRRHYQKARIPGQPPPWKYDPDPVLANLAAQTGLTFTRELRSMRVLCVDPKPVDGVR